MSQNQYLCLVTAVLCFFGTPAFCSNIEETLRQIEVNRADDTVLSQLIPIVKGSFQTTNAEEIMMTKLRNVNTNMHDFRKITDMLSNILATKVINTLPVVRCSIYTPVTLCDGLDIAGEVHLVSIMRSGDALLNEFKNYFPYSPISKILVQRDEETAQPCFKYMKLSPSLGPDSLVIVTEPMVASGGTLSMVIQLLIDQGVKEENITIGCICTAPEGLLTLSNKFPKVNLVMIKMDPKLNERMYIVPGIGDFGDRYFGTEHAG